MSSDLMDPPLSLSSGLELRVLLTVPYLGLNGSSEHNLLIPE